MKRIKTRAGLLIVESRKEERWSFGFFTTGGRAQQPDKSFSDFYQGFFFEHLGDRIKVGESQPYLEKALSPGEIRILDGGKLVVGTSSNCLEMKLLQAWWENDSIGRFSNGYEIRLEQF